MGGNSRLSDYGSFKSLIQLYIYIVWSENVNARVSERARWQFVSKELHRRALLSHSWMLVRPGDGR